MDLDIEYGIVMVMWLNILYMISTYYNSNVCVVCSMEVVATWRCGWHIILLDTFYIYSSTSSTLVAIVLLYILTMVIHDSSTTSTMK